MRFLQKFEKMRRKTNLFNPVSPYTQLHPNIPSGKLPQSTLNQKYNQIKVVRITTSLPICSPTRLVLWWLCNKARWSFIDMRLFSLLYSESMVVLLPLKNLPFVAIMRLDTGGCWCGRMAEVLSSVSWDVLRELFPLLMRNSLNGAIF